MKYVTESLADALYAARKNRMSKEAPEVKRVNESEDYTDVDDRLPEADNEEEIDNALNLKEGEDMDSESEEDDEDVDEARWVTMKNKNHALIDDDGSVIAGGDPKTRKNVSKKEIEAAAKDAGSK